MNFRDFKIGPNDIQRRIDKIIRKFCPDTPLSKIYKFIRKGLIRVNNSKIKEDYIIQEKDIINIVDFFFEEISDTNNKPSELKTELKLDDTFKLNIIFKNENILVINKPYDFLVQKSNKSDIALDSYVKDFYKKNYTDSSLSFTPGPLHRLDRNTTGLLAFSMSLAGARWFSQNIQNHNITKIYRGIIQGKLSEKQIWKDNIQKEFSSNKSFQTVNAFFSEDNVNAFTEVKPVSYGKYNNTDFTFVEFIIHTGKTHQIRAQSALHNFPLLFDTAYNAKPQPFKKKYFLHAYTLNIPVENEIGLPAELHADLPKDFSDFLKKYSF